jgi:serine/threonine-protein kinase
MSRATDEELLPGEIIDGRYRVEQRLGHGGLGVIYRALDVDLERRCALKLLAGDLGVEAREQLRREAKALATLRSGHVASVYAFGEASHHGGRPFFAMEFVEGRDLGGLVHDHYRERSEVPLHRAWQLLRELCDGLSAIHGAGLVHRDIKPENVIVEQRSGRAVIVDFGAAICAADWKSGILGTPYYMPPEAFRGERPSSAFDVYALGCLAFELLTGRRPYEATSYEEMAVQHGSAPIPKASRLRPELAHLDGLFEQMLAKDPAARFPNATALGNALDDRLRATRTASPNGAGDEEPQGQAATPPAGSLRVLVVDDDPVSAKLLARCVQVAFADVHVAIAHAATGAAAIANAERVRPDLIVLDYLLPDTNGVDVLSRVRALGEGGHPEVIVASGDVGSGERWRFDILGVREVVAKPIVFATLVEAIRGVASRRGWVRPLGS